VAKNAGCFIAVELKLGLSFYAKTRYKIEMLPTDNDFEFYLTKNGRSVKVFRKGRFSPSFSAGFFPRNLASGAHLLDLFLSSGLLTE
jgi:hypothetical protein